MATYTITYEQRVDDYGVVTTLTDPLLNVGDTVEIVGANHGLSGFQVVYALPQYLVTAVDQYGVVVTNPAVSIPNQVLFYDAGSDVTRVAVAGATLTSGVCTWITDTDVEDYLGIPLVDAGTATFLDQCARAANQFAYRRRQEAGYTDNPLVAPSDDVKLGTIMIGAAYYRQRSSYNTIASFDGMGTPPATGVTPMIMQLLGINRPQVA